MTPQSGVEDEDFAAIFRAIQRAARSRGMAEHATDHTHGEMDIAEQTASFDLFVKVTKWGSLGVAVLVLWATLTFCTSTGFIGAVVAALVLLAAGVYALREKPQTA